MKIKFLPAESLLTRVVDRRRDIACPKAFKECNSGMVYPIAREIVDKIGNVLFFDLVKPI